MRSWGGAIGYIGYPEEGWIYGLLAHGNVGMWNSGGGWILGFSVQGVDMGSPELARFHMVAALGIPPPRCLPPLSPSPHPPVPTSPSADAYTGPVAPPGPPAAHGPHGNSSASRPPPTRAHPPLCWGGTPRCPQALGLLVALRMAFCVSPAPKSTPALCC